MIPREVYKEAMEESLKNAKALIEESYLVAKNVSKIHGLMLKNLAIEEVSKAYACWQAANSLIPLNHPFIDPKDRISVFRNHDTKNSMYMAIANASLMAGMKKQKGEPITTTPQEVAFMGRLSDNFGKEGTKRRFEWMYVNIVEENGQYKVSSPLKMEKDVHGVDYRGIKYNIGFIEKIDKFSKTKEFKDRLSELRVIFKKFDNNYPVNPIWDI